MVGCDFGGYVHVEDDEANPTVLTTTTNDERRRLATRRTAAAARVDRRRRATATGGEEGRAAGVPLFHAHPMAARGGSGDGQNDGARRLHVDRRRRRLARRGGEATEYERARERGQTKEED
jgi:hypothetical protein